MNTLLPQTHRLVAGTLVALVVVFAAWAALGRIDIVVQAQGKLVPSTSVKVSQPVEGGVVAELLVKDGDRVTRGQTLARLDATAARKEAAALQAELQLAQARLAALSGRSAGHPAIHSEFQARRLALAQGTAAAASALARARSEHEAASRSAAKLEQTREIARTAETSHAQLKAQGFVSELAYQDKLQALVEREADAQALAASREAAQAAVSQATAQLASVQAEHHKELAQEHSQTLAQLARLQAELAKAQHRIEQAEITAPVDGVVNQLAVRAAGQVVAAGSQLMTLVPAGEPLIAEAWVRNEDAGFVAPGTQAKVKLAAFPFQKYGWLDGEVTWVGADSEVPEAMRNAQGEPLFYKARVKLAAQQLVRDGKAFEAKPGMQVVVDVQLGERTLFEYLTSPLKKAVLEAARER